MFKEFSYLFFFSFGKCSQRNNFINPTDIKEICCVSLRQDMVNCGIWEERQNIGRMETERRREFWY